MVRIPAGEFLMGSTEGPINEKPIHQVSVGDFYLDKYEVTNPLFAKFVKETGYKTIAEQAGSAVGLTTDGLWLDIKGANWRAPDGKDLSVELWEQHPVIAVSWEDAEAYCRHYEKRLPAEAEWEYAARAGTATTFWWGNGGPGLQRVENIADENYRRNFSSQSGINGYLVGYEDGFARTAPVGSYEPNPWGLFDMLGNVSEWVADVFDMKPYMTSPLYNSRRDPWLSKYRVIRGGNWSNQLQKCRAAKRNGAHPLLRNGNTGFRCAQSIR